MPTFCVDGRPAPKGSHRSVISKRTGKLIAIQSNANRLRSWERVVKKAARDAGVVLLAKPEPVSVALWFFFPRPKSSKRPEPTVRPDADKLARAVLDALHGVAYEDDCQVIELEVYKRYSKEGREGVTIEVEQYIDPAEEMPF